MIGAFLGGAVAGGLLFGGSNVNENSNRQHCTINNNINIENPVQLRIMELVELVNKEVVKYNDAVKESQQSINDYVTKLILNKQIDMMDLMDVLHRGRLDFIIRAGLLDEFKELEREHFPKWVQTMYDEFIQNCLDKLPNLMVECNGRIKEYENEMAFIRGNINYSSQEIGN